jgi:hypothetical protein
MLLAALLQADLPKEVLEAFAKAESFELLSLDPSKGEREGQGFHGWTVLGKATLKGDVAGEIRGAVRKGAKDSDGSVAKCFEPRHGIRVGGIDLVLCYACLQGQVFKGDSWVRDFPTTAGPAKTLDATLKKAGVPLPGR